eukprot:7134350-Prymnesium_polylepis.1
MGFVTKYLRRHAGRGSSCPLVEVSDTTEVEAESMGGLFVLFGGFAGLAILVAFVQRRQRARAARH